MSYRLPVSGSSVGAVLTGVVVAEGLPIEKVKAPETGWLSAETTRQATVKVPVPSLAGSVTLAVSPASCAWCAELVFTRRLSGS